jgi:hypothetical protein
MSNDPAAPPPPAGEPAARPPLRWETYFNVDPRWPQPPLKSETVRERLEEVQQQLEVVEAGQRVSPEQLAAISEAVAAAMRASADERPRIILPPRESMDVILINANDASRLSEYHTDETRSSAVLGGIVGAVLGQISTLSVTEFPPVHSFVLLAMFVLAAAYCFMDVRRVRARITAVRSGSMERYRPDSLQREIS